MAKKHYIHPSVMVVSLSPIQLMAGSQTEIPFDPGDGTEEALTNENNFWDEPSGGLWDD